MRFEYQNAPALLKRLRTTDRVRAPRRFSHPVFQTARKVTGVKAYCFKTRCRPTYGGVKSLGLFYENRAIYLNPKGQREANGLLHEYCHAFVAEKRGTLDRFNYASTESDEVNTCKIELWLGFVTGYYSYENLIEFIFEYDFEYYVDETYVEDDRRVLWATPASVERFMRECRKLALSHRWARKVAEELKVAGVEAIRLKIRPIKAAFPKHLV